MTYLAHTAHSQFGALWLSLVGWTLTCMSLGLVQWREWQVSDRKVVTSGVAWVGIWRACFNSYTEVSEGFRNMHCRSIRLQEASTPPEIAAGQVLMLLSLLVGLCGNAGGVCAMRSAYFGLGKNSSIRLGFISTGVLCLLAAVLSLVPLVWNLSSVVTNQTIRFPPEFKLPPAPDSQRVGGGISVGVVGSVLMVVSGVVFCSYRLPERPEPGREQLHPSRSSPSEPENLRVVSSTGRDNPTFEIQEFF
ncbi:claudin-34-like [Kryptolebias marmoratus]|uniref:claudin-34-like n=1 Tax=Kryptolebias marmoratus TaxID=37003 RepID=UPI000D531131|nr:claudin-34-like [Kryptolebias marmoratus]XP_037829707.1 claudin-34-like [Kryptolebias marmoratus]